MKLQDMPFSLIREGKKTIETRLYDEKRRKIAIHDIIEFSNINDPHQKITVKVTALLNYATFSDLFDSFPPEDFGGTSKEDLMGIFKYYTKEEERKYTVLGIKIVLDQQEWMK